MHIRWWQSDVDHEEGRYLFLIRTKDVRMTVPVLRCALSDAGRRQQGGYVDEGRVG